MKFTFYGGAREIGGNKILLEENGTKVYLDFGMPFNFGEDYFLPEQYLEPRNADGLAPYFELDLMPKVPRLYSEEMLKHTDLRYEKPDVDAVFVTHHHSDHVGELKFLDEKIPVYMGHGTHAIMDAYAKLYPSFGKYGEHDVREFSSGDRIDIKGLGFRPIHVEHSTPGAYGYIIEPKTEDCGPIVFTGDLRMHGQASEMTEEFVSEAKKASPAVMLCEGTRIPVGGVEEEKNFTEEGVRKKVCGVMDDSKGIVFVHFAMSNVDRFRSIWEACCDCGRKLVIDPRYMYLLDVMRAEGIDWIPKTEDLCLYYRLNKKGDWDEQPYEEVWRSYYGAELDDSWFNITKTGDRRRKTGMWRCEGDMCANNVTFKEIKEKPDEYALFINFSKLTELAHLKPEKADYIYSSSEHFLEGEENKRMRTVMKNWLDHFGIKLHKAHCSGHASAKDIEKMVKRVKPDTVVPIHTLNPEKFCDWCSVTTVENGGRISI